MRKECVGTMDIIVLASPRRSRRPEARAPGSTVRHSLLRPLGMLACILVVAGPAARTAAQDGPPKNTGNRMHDMLARSSQNERSHIADNVLRSVGHNDCDVSATAFLKYSSGRDSFWQASCSDGRQFVLDFTESGEGSVEVLSCQEVQERGASCMK